MKVRLWSSLWLLSITFLLVFATCASAGFKEKYKGKIVPQNIQFNVGEKVDDDGLLLSEERMPQPADEKNRWNRQGAWGGGYAVYSTSYEAELEEDIANIKGAINFEVFSKGRTKIPLVSSTNVGLIEVSVNRGASFVIAEGNKYYLVIDKPGRYKLDIEYLIKVKRERERGPGQFRFEVLPAPISEFEMAVNEKDVDIFVEPSIKVEVKKEEDKTTAWAIMPKTNSIQVRWTKALPKEDITPVEVEPKVYSTIYTFASIGEGLLRCDSSIAYSVLQSEISGVRLVLPDDASVLEVNGRDLRDWKVSKEGSNQNVDVYFKFGVKGNYNLSVAYERAIGEGSVVAQIPRIKTLGVEREKGFIGIASATNVELKVDASENATAIDVKELPTAIWSRTANHILLAFKYLNGTYDIQIEVIRHEEVPVLIAAVDLANYVSLNTKDGKRLTKAVYHIRNNVKQFLRLRLPQGAVLWSASVSNKPVKPARDKKGYILIPLEKSQLRGESLTQFPVEVVYLERGSKMGVSGSLKAELPRVDIPTSELYWSLYLPVDFAYYKFGGDLNRVEKLTSIFSLAPLVSGRAEQNAVRKKSLSQYTAQRQYEGKMLDEVSKKGALPIKITVPERGKVFRFSKLLVSENEKAGLSLRYIDKSKKWFKKIFLFTLALGVVVLIVVIKVKKALKI